MRLFVIPALFLLTACPGPIVKERLVNVSVPVTVPCVKDTRPAEVVPLNQRYTQEQWDALTTDQREKLIVAAGARHKTYGNELYVATAGCL